MKKIKILPLMLLILLNIQAQTDIDDKTQSQKINAIPYDGSFMTFTDIESIERKAGVVGEKVTLVDVGYYFIFDGERALENNKFITADEAHKFRNKTFKVIDYKHEPPDDILVIKNADGTFFWKLSDLSTYVFNRYLDTLKSNIEGKRFIPLYDDEELRSLEGKIVKFNGSQTYTITKVKFTKIKKKYVVALLIDDTHYFIYPTGYHDQPGSLNGETYIRNKNWINIQSGGNDNKVIFIEENTYHKLEK